jgi:hypothetical protein
VLSPDRRFVESRLLRERAEFSFEFPGRNTPPHLSKGYDLTGATTIKITAAAARTQLEIRGVYYDKPP